MIRYGSEGVAYLTTDGALFAISDVGGRVWADTEDELCESFDITEVWHSALSADHVTDNDVTDHRKLRGY